MEHQHSLPPRAAETGDRAEVQAISDWLVGQGLRTSGFEELFAGFCARLAEAGIPLWRGFVAMRTLHPSVASISYTWRPERGVEAGALLHDETGSDEVLGSPIQYMFDHETYRLRIRLDRPSDAPHFAVLDDFRAAGATDYFASAVPFRFPDAPGGRAGVVTSWTTARSGGFDERELAVLERLLPRLSMSLKGTLTYEIARTLLDTYVGPDAGRRILGGRIRRGQAEVIRAGILFADLSGFTALSDTIGREALLPTLNAYFECMVAPVTERGGQVLKFIGDGLLAVFNLSAGERGDICRAALDAALDAMARVERLNESRAAAGRRVLPLHMALHLGEVFYGNVGAHDRQDFTVIGPAVNEASRIEALCGVLDRKLLISATFAGADPVCCGRLTPVGFHVLRGVREPLELFTVEEG